MSEYQYYEFQALDRPLTAEQQAQVRRLSSRVELTPSQAVFTYSYGDFRGEPLDVLAAYFDIMLYLANWGTRQLAFRLPCDAVDEASLRPYLVNAFECGAIELRTTPAHLLLSITVQEEEPLGWIEGEGILSGLAPLREQILDGDRRVLYLAWLAYVWPDGAWPSGADAAADDADVDEVADPTRVIEPPVPPGLGRLNAPLRAFAELFEIDRDLIAAAAEASPPLPATDEPIEDWVRLLPEAERLAYLVRLARGEPAVAAELRRRLRELGRRDAGQPVAGPRRTAAELLARVARQAREARERRAAEEARRRRLAEVAAQEPALWAQAQALIERKTATAYDEAVAILADLHALARQRDQPAQFADRLDSLLAGYSRRPALIERLRRAKVL